MTPASPLAVPILAPADLPATLANQRAFEDLLARDKAAERRLAWVEALCLALAVGSVLLGRMLAERL